MLAWPLFVNNITDLQCIFLQAVFQRTTLHPYKAAFVVARHCIKSLKTKAISFRFIRIKYMNAIKMSLDASQ